jgi:YidC/Oxa1 family membrane protein insertase
MTALRDVVGHILRLTPIDLLTAVAIAALAFSLAAAPVVGQQASDGRLSSPGSAASPSPGSAEGPGVAASSALATPPSVPPAGTGPVSASPDAAASPDAPASPDAAAPSATVRGASPAAPTGAAPSPGGSPSPSATPAPPCPLPDPTPTPPAPGATPRHLNLCPAEPRGADPIALLAWLFTPIFQVLFMGLALLYDVFGDIGTAIVVLTIIIRILLVPVFRAQIVSQRRMQMLQPELRAIQVKYKGNRTKISEEQMKLYRERGVNPASGCLPALLQLVLLLPMYQVFNQGLSAPDISSMLQVFGQPVITVQCQQPGNPDLPCIDPNVWWLAWLPKVQDGFQVPGYPGGLPANKPEVFWDVLPGVFGLSLLALVSAILQLVQTRMMATQSDDPQVRSQQRLFLLLPLFSLIYGTMLPAGLFIYWITTTIFSIVQQYLINGWGGLFPLFGWTPRFAVDHQPRFPVSFTPRPSGPESPAGSTAPATRRTTTESAAGTIRPARGRSSRRGRRR